MSDLIKTESDLNSFINEGDFVERTCSQINKDFSTIYPKEIDFQFNSNETLLKQLIYQLSKVIDEVSKMGSGTMLQLMYTNYLTENKYYNSLGYDDSSQKLAFLIIQREAQKVYLKNKFS